MGEGVDEIAVGVFGQALQGHRAAGGIPDQALQLVAPMGRDLGVGVGENPWTPAQRGPASVGVSPASPKPEPMRRTC